MLKLRTTKMERSVLCSFLFLAVITASNALYFHIGETEKKCFIEEIPDETMVVGKYRCTLNLEGPAGFAYFSATWNKLA